MANLTRDDFVRLLQRVAAIEPDRPLTQHRFQTETGYERGDWHHFFGTFLEFKRAAGLELSREANRVRLNIAKHAAADTLRQMNEEKADWGEKFLRPCKRRFQTVLHFADLHDTRCDPFFRRVLLETALRVQPEKIIIGGDAFDLAEFGKYGVDPREWDVVGRIKWVHSFLAELRAACPDAELIFIEGNHEYRLLRHLAEATPALRAVLSDLHGFTVPRLLGLDAFEVNYISRSDLSAFNQRDVKEELNRNFYIAHDCYLAHHFPEGQKMGFPGAHGHHHRHEVSQSYSPIFGAFEWHQLGAGHRRQASYTPGEHWGMGFNLAHIDTHNKRVQHDYQQVLDDFAMVGGLFYRRDAKE